MKWISPSRDLSFWIEKGETDAMKLYCETYTLVINRRQGYGKFCLAYIKAAGKEGETWFSTSFLDTMNAAWRGFMNRMPGNTKPRTLSWDMMGKLAYHLETEHYDDVDPLKLAPLF